MLDSGITKRVCVRRWAALELSLYESENHEKHECFGIHRGLFVE